MTHCTNSFGQGWRHMIAVLFSPFRIGFWLLMTVLAFISELTNIIPMPSFSKEQLESLNNDPSIIEPYLMTILIACVAYFFVLLIFTLFASASRILFFVGVRNGKVPVMQTLGEQASRIITYFLWNVIVPMFGLIMLGIFGFVLALVILLPMGATDITSLGIVAIIVFSCFGLFSLFLAILYMILMNAFVLPQMIFQDKGIFQAWGNTIGLVFGEFFEFIGFCLIRTAIGAAVFVLLLLPLLVVGFIFAAIESTLGESMVLQMLVVMALKIPLIIIIECVLLPISLFLDSYALAFLHGLTGDQRFISANAIQSVAAQSDAAQTVPPAINPATSKNPAAYNQPASNQPRSTPDSRNSPPNNQEPISFKDIPVEPSSIPSSPPLNPHSTEHRINENDDKKEPPIPPGTV